MFDWVVPLIADLQCGTEQNMTLAEQGASAQEIIKLEAQLGVSLPKSYKTFVQLWDGGTFWGDRIFSLSEIRHYINNMCGFALYDGKSIQLTAQKFLNPNSINGTLFSCVYNLKPTHFLAFCEPCLAADLYCFDTSISTANEYPICYFPHDNDDLESILKIKYPSFETYFLYTVYEHLLDDFEAFYNEDAEDDIAAEEWAEERQNYWSNLLKEKLIAKGAKFSDPYSLKWSF